jgi:hypothetical protein
LLAELLGMGKPNDQRLALLAEEASDDVHRCPGFPRACRHVQEYPARLVHELVPNLIGRPPLMRKQPMRRTDCLYWRRWYFDNLVKLSKAEVAEEGTPTSYAPGFVLSEFAIRLR